MNMQQIQQLLNDFHITEEELKSRKNLKEFSNSFSSIIINKFVADYIVKSKELSIYIAHIDDIQLISKMEDFLSFLLVAPIDEKYIQRIYDVGALHFSIKLEPSKVSYGFWALCEILDQIASINKVVAKNKKLISKLFRFVEYIMNESYNLCKSKEYNMSIENKPFVDLEQYGSLDEGKLAIDSSMNAIRYISKIITSKRKIQKDLKDTIEFALEYFAWVIDTVDISNNFINISQYDIHKILHFEIENLHIGIKLNKFNPYIQEILFMFLEVLDLHLTMQDREQALVVFAEKVENANKAKDMFLANMSHELRTPLNAIIGFAQILQVKKDIPIKTKTYIEKIYIAGKNLLDLVNTILDFAKLEAQKMPFNPQLRNIATVVNEAKTLVELLAQKKNITLTMPKIVSLNIFVDDKLFKQVIVNLLTNAIKFTQDGGDVTLAIEYNYAKQSYKFKVQDNGIGISKEGIKKLFQPFSQVDDSHTKQEQGTGLGLMISKKIIEDLHKGRIWVESIEDEGSIFYVEMPLGMIESQTFIVDEAPQGAHHLLVVEDSKDYQNILIEHLKKTHKLTITDSVNKSKNLLRENSYDYLILDFFLIDGISAEILQFMEKEEIFIPSIVISAEDSIEILPSLKGSSNLEGIMTKDNILAICHAILGDVYEDD